MNQALWRNTFSGSSKQYASKMLAAGVNETVSLKTLVLSMAMTVSSLANAQSSKLDKVIDFNIPQQRADMSLTDFARQANITLIFPYDVAADITANPLVGDYSIAEALRHLLDNTALTVNVGDGEQLMIAIDPSFRKTDKMFKKTELSSAVAGVLSTLVGVQAIAQESAPIEEMLVTGLRGSLQRSMDIKRESGGVVDAISAEDIGKFPDTNLAESLQRITGVSIDRSGGEGQLITVRGFGPQFNTVLVNGRQIASESPGREFSFDTLASEMVSGIDVYKTSTAATQSGGIGSTVKIKTARPFDIGGFKVVGSIKAVADSNSEETTPQAAGFISYANDRFGVLFGLAHQQRKTQLNKAHMDGWLENVGIPPDQLNGGQGVAEGTTIFSPRNYDHTVQFEERTRNNGNLVLQFAASENLTITADLLYSDFDVQTDATSYGHWFTAPNIENARSDANGTVIDLYQEVGLATDMHAKKFDRLTSTLSSGILFDWTLSDNLTLQFDLSHSSAERDPNNGRGNQLSLIGYANRVRFSVDNNILPLASEFTDANATIFSGQQEIDKVAYRDPSAPDYVPPAGVLEHTNKANSRAHVMLRRGWAAKDDVSQIKMDGIWDENADSGLIKGKFGLAYSSQEKALERWDNEGVGIHCTYCGYPDLPPIPTESQYLFDAGSDFLSMVSGSGRMPTRWLAHDGEAHFRYLEAYYADVNGESISFDAVKRNNSTVIKESTVSAYFELDFQGDFVGRRISSSAGVRLESTSVTVDGTTAPVSGLEILDETEMLATYGPALPVAQKDSYDVILPNMDVKWDLSDSLVARLAASKTITRPTLASMSPVTVITTTRQGGDLTSTSGNPNLAPFESDNFDVSLEWYYGDTSYVSGGVFKKNVANFIVNAQEIKTFELADGSLLTDPSAGNTVAEFTDTAPQNGETASVQGVELAWQQAFGESGFGYIINATFVNSDTELDPGNIEQTFAVTGLSDTRNLVLYYENYGFQARLAYNWRDQFVQSLTQTQGDGPTLVEAYEQWDFSASYDINDNVGLFFEGINLTEEYVHKRGRYDNHLLLIEDSGRRFAFGVRANF